MPPLDPISAFKKKAAQLGFIAAGFSPADPPLFFDYLQKWVKEGRHGLMSWMERNLDIRRNPEKLLRGCRTVISLGYPYSSQTPATRDGFTAARYTESGREDYHLRIKRLAGELAADLRNRFPGSRTRVCVDSAPVMERSYAYKAGLGFIGKNNMLIVPGHGSYLFLAEILTTAPLPSGRAHTMEGGCGDCTRCLDACPTGALARSRLLDASRCLSYLTIEDPRPVDAETGTHMGRGFFGCDACQEACPFNRREEVHNPVLPSSEEFLAMTEDAFAEKFGETAFSRAGLEKIKGNLRAILSGTSDRDAT